MHTETQAGLDTSKAFLRDAVELSHLMIRKALEAARAGEQVDWDNVRELVREGRTSARQLSQIASLEVRDRALDLREIEGKYKRKRQDERADVHHVSPQLEGDRVRFLEHSEELSCKVLDSLEHSNPVDYSHPDDIREMLTRYGLDPEEDESLEKLALVLFPEADGP